MKVRILTREVAGQKTPEILGLERYIENIGGPKWTEENLMKELPMKWELSFLMESDDEQVMGYLIASNLHRRYHIHRPFIHPSLRKVATLRLIRQATKIAMAHGFKEISWKVGEGIETLDGSFRLADRYDRIEDIGGVPFYMFYKNIEAGDISKHL